MRSVSHWPIINGRRTPWTPERVNLLCDLWHTGMLAKDIADALGFVSERGVQSKARKLGLPRRKHIGEWPEEQDRELIRLRREGHTFVQIAERMGLTKGKVIGRAARLGLMHLSNPRGKSTVTHGRTDFRRTPRGQGRAQQTPQAVIDAAPAPPIPETAVTFMDLKPHHCRWVYGDPSGTETIYCGAPVTPGSKLKFCPYHTHQAQTADRVKRESTNKKRGRLTAFQSENSRELEAGG